MSVQMQGMDALLRNLGQLPAKVDAAAGDGLRAVALRAGKAAQDRAPVLTGELRASMYVGEVVRTADGMTVEVGFTAEHAGRVHEDTGAFHPDGQSKFLEDAVNETAREVPAEIGAALQRGLQ